MLRDVKYNFINDNTCPLCNMRAESTHHYFLVCPALATPRATLLSRVFQILRNLPNQYVLFSARQSSSELHQLLLNGSSLLPPDVNLQLFDVVAQYIVNSQRFDIWAAFSIETFASVLQNLLSLVHGCCETFANCFDTERSHDLPASCLFLRPRCHCWPSLHRP